MKTIALYKKYIALSTGNILHDYEDITERGNTNKETVHIIHRSSYKPAFTLSQFTLDYCAYNLKNATNC